MCSILVVLVETHENDCTVYSGDLWFSALTHGNSASVCLQAFSLMGCGYELLKLEEKLETRPYSARATWKGDLLALPLLPLPSHQQLLRCSAFHHRRPSAASTHPATPTTTSRPQLFIPQCRSAFSFHVPTTLAAAHRTTASNITRYVHEP